MLAERTLSEHQPASVSEVEKALAGARFSLGNGEAHDWRSYSMTPAALMLPLPSSTNCPPS